MSGKDYSYKGSATNSQLRAFTLTATAGRLCIGDMFRNRRVTITAPGIMVRPHQIRTLTTTQTVSKYNLDEGYSLMFHELKRMVATITATPTEAHTTTTDKVMPHTPLLRATATASKG